MKMTAIIIALITLLLIGGLVLRAFRVAVDTHNKTTELEQVLEGF